MYKYHDCETNLERRCHQKDCQQEVYDVCMYGRVSRIVNVCVCVFAGERGGCTQHDPSIRVIARTFILLLLSCCLPVTASYPPIPPFTLLASTHTPLPLAVPVPSAS